LNNKEIIMCNYLHKTSERNWKRKFGDKKWGFGYKCFLLEKRNSLGKKRKEILHPVWRYGIFHLDEWIKWRKHDESGDGFCFFLTCELLRF